ncbi:hypothetical protein Tco_0046117 [Tanacetum coccineum]
MEALQDISGCRVNQKARGREAVVGMTWEDLKALMKEEYCPNNKIQKLETEFWGHTMVGAGHAAYTDQFHKLARLIRRMVAATEPPTIQSVILKAEVLTNEAVRNGSLKKSGEKRGDGEELSKGGDVKGDNKRARNEKLNRAPGEGENHPNQALAIEGGQCHGNNGNPSHGRAFIMGAEEAHQNPNIMTDIKPSSLGFSYEIKIASGEVVEINKVIRDCKLEIEGYTGHRPNSVRTQKLRFFGERPEEKVKHLMSAKAEEQKLEGIAIVRNFSDVFPDDLSG